MSGRDECFIDDGLRVWIVRTSQKHFWRMAAWYDLDDLIQDGYMCHARTRSRYPELFKKENYWAKGGRAKAMAMFKRVFLNHIHDLATARTKNSFELHVGDLEFSNEQADGFLSDDEKLDVLHGGCPEEQSFAATIANAPKQVRRFLENVVKDEGAAILREGIVMVNGHRETTNERFCRIAGCEPAEINLPDALRSVLVAS